jgi:predicted molibdopterin-dependent oxidoreductase YjgC
MKSRFVQLAETERPSLSFSIDGRSVQALQGDTLLVAILRSARTLRRSEFGGGARAGFCLMGACQDCWVQTVDGKRIRACTTAVEAGMQIVTMPAEDA